MCQYILKVIELFFFPDGLKWKFLVKAVHAGAGCLLWSLAYVLENKAKCHYLCRSVKHMNNNWELFSVAVSVGVIP